MQIKGRRFLTGRRLLSLRFLFGDKRPSLSVILQTSPPDFLYSQTSDLRRVELMRSTELYSFDIFVRILVEKFTHSQSCAVSLSLLSLSLSLTHREEPEQHHRPNVELQLFYHSPLNMMTLNGEKGKKKEAFFLHLHFFLLVSPALTWTRSCSSFFIFPSICLCQFLHPLSSAWSDPWLSSPNVSVPVLWENEALRTFWGKLLSLRIKWWLV